MRLLVSFIVAWGIVASSHGQQSAPQQRGFPDRDPASPKAGRHYVVAIGIDHYQNWPLLSTAVSDATGFARLLTSQFGYEYPIAPLVEKGASRDAINALIEDVLPSKLQPQDDLILFFAGHGTTRSFQVGAETHQSGFIVPFNARAPGQDEHWSDYIAIDELLRNISKLPAAHILVILDSCHSGIALGNGVSSARGDARFQADMLRKISRMVITSAQGDQTAADTGPVPQHSLFTGLMMQGLTSGKADSFQQGFITATELGSYVQHEVGVQQSSRQTPRFGAFDLDGGGELIIPLGAGSSDQAHSNTTTAAGLTSLETSEVARIRKDGQQYWQTDDTFRNFPAARSATLKLCETGDAWACGQAAHSFQLGLGGAKNFERAISLAQQGCESKSAESCVVLGNLKEDGYVVRKDWDAANALYERACNDGNLRGCTDIANLLLNDNQDDDVPQNALRKDPHRAIELYTKACNGGELFGCTNFGVMYERGRGIEQDYKKAVSLYKQACDGGQLTGCANLGSMYRLAHGVEKNTEIAFALYTKACNGSEIKGCEGLGDMYREGNGVAQDYGKASVLYRQGCVSGHYEDCNPADLFAQMNSLNQDCDSGRMTSCTALAQIYISPKSFSLLEADPRKGMALYGKACDGGELESCVRLGDLYISNESPNLPLDQNVPMSGMPGQSDSKGSEEQNKAIALFTRACDGGNGLGCYRLGSRYEKGRGVEKDLKRAFVLYTKACDANFIDSCYSLATLYEYGRGIDHDYDKALTLYQKSCLIDDDGKEVCDEHRSLSAFIARGKACDRGEMASCAEYGSGLDIRGDVAKAVTVLGKACDAGTLEDCYVLGKHYLTTLDGNNEEWKTRVCRRAPPIGIGEIGYNPFGFGYNPLGYSPYGMGAACPSLKSGPPDYENGTAVDYNRVITLYTQACKGGNDFSACWDLSGMFETGHGVKADEVKAREYIDRACKIMPGNMCASKAVSIKQ